MNFDNAVLQVPIEDIIPNRNQPRLAFDDASLQELAASIKQHGVIQPIVLRKVGEKYEIIAGERRYKASKIAGLTSIPAVISNIDDQKSAEVSIVENIQRKNLTSIEEAKSYKALLDQGFMSQEELAKRMGLSQSAISNKLRLLNLAPEVQDAIMKEKISERHARSLLSIKNPDEQIKWLQRIIEERLNVRELDTELKKSYSINDNESIDYIKNNATDISIETKPEASPIIDFGPIDLGETNKSKFYNELENEAVNMNTNNFSSNFNTDFNAYNENDIGVSDSVESVQEPLVMEIPVQEPEVDELVIDSLEFEPPKKGIVDFEDKLHDLFNQYPEYKVTIIKNNQNNKDVYTIEIKENN